MASTRDIDIGRDFSLITGGRRRRSGAHSAEAFRDDLLIPALCAADRVVVHIGGPSYSMAWLEEVFGTLECFGFTPADLSRRLVIQADGGYRYTRLAIETFLRGPSGVPAAAE
jgi:hypothetical protein